MPYVTYKGQVASDTLGADKEITTTLADPNNKRLLTAGGVVGILYKDASVVSPDETTSKTNRIDFLLGCEYGYPKGYMHPGKNCETTEGWHYMIFDYTIDSYSSKFVPGMNIWARFDIFNGSIGQYNASMDVAFIGFFNTVDEANAYYESICVKYPSVAAVAAE
jgi:hypothetical protein